MSCRRPVELTQSTFNNLLRSLHADEGEAAHVYERLRLILITFFARRRCSSPEDLVDYTFDRVAIKASEKPLDVLRTHADSYFRRVARFIYLEHVRDETRYLMLADTSRPSQLEAKVACLDLCKQRLPFCDQHFFEQYESATSEEREALASQLHTTKNALSLRAFKIRKHLERCTRDCFQRWIQFGTHETVNVAQFDCDPGDGIARVDVRKPDLFKLFPPKR